MLAVQADRHTQFRKSAVWLRSWNAGWNDDGEWQRIRAAKQPVSAGPGPWSHNTEPGSAEFGTKAGEYLARIGHGTRLITSVVPVSMPLKAPDALSRPLASRSRVPGDLSAGVRARLAQYQPRMPRSRSSRAASRKPEQPPRTQLYPVDEVGLVNDLTHDCRPSAPDYNVVGAPVAGSIGVVADDVELVEPGVVAPVNESTWP